MRSPSLADSPLPLRSSARYEVHEEVARGGMGTIYRAYDRFTSRVVAYKRLTVATESMRARATALFQREFETLARLPHPNIVQVYDFGWDEFGPFYAMELLSGDDLTKVAPLPFRDACRVLRDVASALALLHARRLVHRDVSPNNIRLTADGRAKLLDFGALTSFGKPKELVGTPVCIAPECLEGAPLDQGVDLYALGAVAYWLLTRRMHVRASTLSELSHALKEPVIPPSQHVRDIPKELDDLVMALLSRDPLARPESAASVMEALTQLGGLAPEADERSVAFSYLAQPPLFGRDEVLSSVREHVDGVLRGSGSNLLLEAARGLGRSAILDQAATYAQSAGATVVRVHGARSGPAFSSALAIVEALVALHPDLHGLVELRETMSPSAPKVLGPARVDSPAQVAERHANVLASAQDVVLEAVRRSPLLLAVDDLDQLDEHSAALIASLAESVVDQPLAIVASASSTNEAGRTPAVRVFHTRAKALSLAPLSLEELTQLTQSVFGRVPNAVSFAKWLFAESSGNPATVLDLTRLLLQEGFIRYTRGTFSLPQDASREVAPALLSQVNVGRLAGVSPAARSVAVALALHGRALRFQQLSSLLDAPIADVIVSVEELGKASVVGVLEENVTLMSSALATSLLASVDSEQKRTLHARLAEVLLAEDQSFEVRMAGCRHLLAAGDEARAADMVATLARDPRHGGGDWAAWADVLEAVLDRFKREQRRKEECLALMTQLVNAGFYGELAVQTRHIDLTLEWMSEICGIKTARRLSSLLGARLALLLGIMYAFFRRAVTPKQARLGTVPQMLDGFSRLVSAAVAAAASALDVPTARRAVDYLEPFAILPPHTPGFLLREFCLATCALTSGAIKSALERYERLLKIFSKPVPGLLEEFRKQLYLGCLNGLAQGGLWHPEKRVLEVADELVRDPFFAPHGECARMFYHGYRGERAEADLYRSRVEAAALNGGTSWSAMVLVAVHSGLAAMRTRDRLALIHAHAEQRRLTAIAPALEFTAAACEAWLEHLRGNHERAAELFERIVFLPELRASTGYPLLLTLYATVLCALERYEEAKQVSLLALDGEDDPARVHVLSRDALTTLAFAEHGLGNRQRGRELLDRALLHDALGDNPLQLGNRHRDRAMLALTDNDREQFELHFGAMQSFYRATNHPALLIQAELLGTAAERAGLRARRAGSGDAERGEDLDLETVLSTTAADVKPCA